MADRTAKDPPSGAPTSGGVPVAFPPRSTRSSGGGFDRVGGSRLTSVGAILLTVAGIGALSPPTSTDRQLAGVIWVVFVGVLVVGIVVPLVLVRRVRVEATSPRDATVGDDVPIRVEVSGRCAGLEIRALDPTGPWHRASAPSTGALVHLADRRGVFQAIRVEVRVTAPLGILAAHRVHWVWMPQAVEVAPRALPVTWVPQAIPVDGGMGPVTLASPTGDLVRSVRPYVSGDPPHLVHWPSSARLGELVVRELEPPVPVGAAVVVDLTGLGALSEKAASYALGACRAVLAAGGELVLATCEAQGPVVAPVRFPIDAGRRLARAVPGTPGPAPHGWPLVEIGA